MSFQNSVKFTCTHSILAFGLLLSGAMSLSACATFDRSSSSGYGQQTDTTSTTKKDLLRDKESRKTAYELGLDPASDLSGEDNERINNRMRLRSLEKTLGSQKEREQYSKILPWLKNDREKIEFLSIPSLEGRQQWVNNRGVWERAKMPQAEMKEMIDSQDIAVGMPQDYVKKSWGDPQSVEVSGNPLYKNERWKYQRFVSSTDGYKKEVRYVYFEGGRVVGWETE